MKLTWVIVICTICISFVEADHRASPGYRLPGDVVPSHYDVRLLYDIDPETHFTFYGVVKIQIQVKKPTSQIILHAEKYAIKNDGISVSNGTLSHRVVNLALDDSVNLFTISLDSPLTVDIKYNLTIPFSGNLSMTDMYGVYVSYYNDKKAGAREYLISTQFQAIFARRAFPCFDEPIYKATFGLTLGHNKGYTAISNMPISGSSNANALLPHWSWDHMTKTIKKPQSDFVWDKFGNSVIMSTYLVAFVISKMQHKQSTETAKWKFRVWARPGAIEQTEYALAIGPKILKYYEKLFNMSFPLPKQDMVAIPNFFHGAMENWGITTYKDTSLLFDKKESSLIDNERIAMTVAHELAHQWFGNLVTFKWWSDLWLNEGFATYISTLGVAAAEPKWEYGFEGYEVFEVLEMDALESSHSVSMDIVDPSNIMEVFDAISYLKGSVLIRMLTMFLGNKIFEEAIHNYLVKYSYCNTDQNDLWEELTAVSQKNNVLPKNMTVKQVMDSWTTQIGFPLLTVTRDYNSKTFTVIQARYLASNPKNSTSSSSWWIPLGVMSEPEALRQSESMHWLASGKGVTEGQKYEHKSKSNQWILINANMMAPYRVNYDSRNWKLLVDALRGSQFKNVPSLGRVQLLSDAFELAWTNRLNYSTALRLAKYLQQETQFAPLMAGLRALSNIDNILKRTLNYGVFKKFMRNIITNTYLKLGGMSQNIVHKDHLEKAKVQILINEWACRMEVPNCEENAIRLFKTWMDVAKPDEHNPIPLDLRRTVYCTAVSRGGEEHWQFMLDRKRRSNVAMAVEIMQRALSCTKEAWRHRQIIEWVVTSTEQSEVLPQDIVEIVTNTLESPVGYFIGKDFLYTRVRTLYKDTPPLWFGLVISELLNRFMTQSELDEFLSWRDENLDYLKSISMEVQRGIERARVNIAWAQNNMDNVVLLLKAEGN